MLVPTITIRSAVPNECDEIARIYVSSWNAGYGHLMRYRKVDSELVARWRRDLAAPPPTRWWVAEVDGTIVGFAGIGLSRDPVDPSLGELDTIAVDLAWWRKGVGRALMSQSLRYLSEDGYAEAVVWTLKDYPQGDAFYRATGWTPNGWSRAGGRQVSYSHPLPVAAD